MNAQERGRAIAEARGLSNQKLAQLLADGPSGIQPDAWQVLIDEQRERVERERAVEPAQPRWGSIGFRSAVSLPHSLTP